MAETTRKEAGKGYWGRICVVDLGSGKIQFEELSDDVYRKFLGGVGLGAKFLWERMKPGIDPLGPDNILGFTPGLLTDTGSLFTGRFTVVAKSPASGSWGDANCGGYFSPFLKRCAVDALFFRGAAERPVYLYLNDRSAELRDASDLWGLDTVETETQLKQRHGKGAQVACIGPAGERLSLLAGISNDGGRIAARGGLGAVMGSKKLKAVVAAGKQRVGVADAAEIRRLSERFRKKIRDWQASPRIFNDRVMALFGWMAAKGLFNKQISAVWRVLLRGYGTPSLVAMSAENGDSPTKNWGGAANRDFPFRNYHKIGMMPVKSYETQKYGCYSCPVRCGGHVSVTDGPYKIEKMHKPEYETICAFGDMLLNDDLHSIFEINDIVNRGGIDSISCGGVVAFAIECYMTGILTKNDTSGLELTWGNARAIVDLTRMIVNREGIGDVLADGVKKAAEKIGKGAEQFAVHCGGVEAPMHNPRFDPGWGFTYYCDPSPGRHTVSCNQFVSMQHLKRHFTAFKGSAAAQKAHGSFGPAAHKITVGAYYKMLIDCAGACLFGTQVGGDLPICQWMNAATGWHLTNDEYLLIGERIQQLRHAFTLREGLNPIRDFRPHPRIYGDPPMTYGPLKGVKLDLDAMASSYYRVNEWDESTGMPDVRRLQELGLNDVVEGLGLADR
jgi:aldehyde:ferredoxin oxidoreductase